MCRTSGITLIHPSAIVDKNAIIGNNTSIGAYSVISGNVVIGDDCEIGPHVVIKGPTRIGNKNRILQFASLGEDPQDKKYDGEATELHIGDNNLIREFVTINRGTTQDRGITTIGNDNWIMAYVHIAHDCTVGNHTIFSNSASLAGHVNIEDHVILSGFTLVHQFCSVGEHAFTGMNSVIAKDVPPYILVSGHMAHPHGLNSEGLKRRGFSSQTISNLKKAYKLLYRSGLSLEQACEQIADMQNDENIDKFINFIRQSQRGILR